jgi:hypothetical protein
VIQIVNTMIISQPIFDGGLVLVIIEVRKRQGTGSGTTALGGLARSAAAKDGSVGNVGSVVAMDEVRELASF